MEIKASGIRRERESPARERVDGQPRTTPGARLAK